MKHLKLFEEHINERLMGQGTQHMVYDLGKDRVKKVGPDTQEQAKYFKKFPNEFPRVYNFSKEDMSLEIEKLDVEKFKADFHKHVRSYDLFAYRPFGAEHIEIFQKLTKDLSPKGKQMANRIKEIVNRINMQDIHINQFGYTKRGEIKAFDY